MPETEVRTTTLASGERIPVLGVGTWRLAEQPQARREEMDALRLGIDLGMTLIDTAEMYADGAAEELVGEAIEGRRDEVFLVSKVLPSNGGATATRPGLRGQPPPAPQRSPRPLPSCTGAAPPLWARPSMPSAASSTTIRSATGA